MPDETKVEELDLRWSRLAPEEKLRVLAHAQAPPEPAPEVARLEVALEATKCTDCPFHEVVADPDPYDSFCSDDLAVLCTRSPNTTGSRHHAAALGPFAHRPVTTSCRPYKLDDETTPVPSWCPIRVPKEGA